MAGVEAATAPPAVRPAPLFERLGNFSRPISIANPLAQRYFNQGLVLAYGFNRAEAKRSFLAALSLVSNRALCAWGVSPVLGPNINLPMSDADNAEAFALAKQVERLSGSAKPVERAFVAALLKRYMSVWVADERAALDREYANAMRAVAREFPRDADVLVLFAEALLDTNPWNYWLPGGSPTARDRRSLGRAAGRTNSRC